MTSRLGARQQRVLCLMDSNGGRLPLNHRWRAIALVAQSLMKHGLAVWVNPEDQNPFDIRLTSEGRTEASHIRASRPEICFSCDKNQAVYVRFSGAQGGQDIGYPAAHLYCTECVDPDHPGRLYRLEPVTS